MWKDRFRSVFGESSNRDTKSSKISSDSAKASAGSVTRQSNGFEQFFKQLQCNDTLSVLDLAGVSQANISFITSLGHRLSSEDLTSIVDQCFADDGDFLENQLAASRIQRFVDQSLNFEEEQFDGALVWDTLQFMAPPLLEQTVERLLRVMRPGGLLLAFFYSDDKVPTRPIYNYRIVDQKTLQLNPRGTQRKVQHFNNRTIERLFENAQSLKFFLTRDNLREVIVRK